MSGSRHTKKYATSVLRLLFCRMLNKCLVYREH